MWYAGSSAFGAGDIGYAESAAPAWKQMKSMNIAKGGSASAVIGNKIYVFGGMGAGYTLYNSAEVYNTETNEWSALPSIAMEIAYLTAGVINNKIYLVGGYYMEGASWATTNSTWEYDPEGAGWTKKADCPVNIADQASCVMNNKMYILGGLQAWPPTDTPDQNKVFVYDPASDTWESMQSMIYPRGQGASAVALNDTIFVIGGAHPTASGVGTYHGKIERYEPVSDIWTEIADMPFNASWHINVVHENKILIFGGGTGNTYADAHSTDLIQEYDPLTNQWRRMYSMPFTREDLTAQKLGDFVYLIGGLKNDELNSVVPEVWRFNLNSLQAWNYVTGIGLDKHSIELEPGGKGELVATISPPDASDLSVMWTSGDPEIASVEEGAVTGEGAGITYVYVTTADGNFRDSCLVTVTFVEGINMVGERSIRIYPNPANDLLTIETIHSGHHSIEITSLNGQLLYTGEMEGTSHQIDLSSFRKGVYFLTIRSEAFITTKKIIKL